MFVVTHLQISVRDEDTVRGAKARLDPSGEVHALLNQDDRVSAGLPGLLHMFQYVGGITGGAVVHLLIEPGEVLGQVLGFHAQCLAELVLAKRVSIGALCGVIASLVVVILG
jgi:hypothetical protein